MSVLCVDEATPPRITMSLFGCNPGNNLLLTFFGDLAMFTPQEFILPAEKDARPSLLTKEWSMLPLQVDDLLPLDEYARRRREFFDSHRRYIDRYRRVRIGPRLTLIFENRQTLWFRVQEIMRIARLADTRQVQQELNLYNRLLPGRNLLQAALLIEIADEAHLAQEMAAWKDLDGSQLCLRVGKDSFPSTLVTCRPEDRCMGTAHWVQFALGQQARDLLLDVTLPAFFAFDNGTYQHHSALLSEEHRQSLLDDLNLSDRD